MSVFTLIGIGGLVLGACLVGLSFVANSSDIRELLLGAGIFLIIGGLVAFIPAIVNLADAVQRRKNNERKWDAMRARNDEKSKIEKEWNGSQRNEVDAVEVFLKKIGLTVNRSSYSQNSSYMWSALSAIKNYYKQKTTNNGEYKMDKICNKLEYMTKKENAQSIYILKNTYYKNYEFEPYLKNGKIVYGEFGGYSLNLWLSNLESRCSVESIIKDSIEIPYSELWWRVEGLNKLSYELASVGAGAIAGGLLGGGIGAVLGANSYSKKTQSEDHRYVVLGDNKNNKWVLADANKKGEYVESTIYELTRKFPNNRKADVRNYDGK